MTLKDQWILDGQLFVTDDFDVFPFCELVDYTVLLTSVTTVGIPMLVDDPLDALDEEEGVVVTNIKGLLRSSGPLSIASPATGDLVTIRGKRCRVEGHTPRPNGSNELELSVGKTL